MVTVLKIRGDTSDGVRSMRPPVVAKPAAAALGVCFLLLAIAGWFDLPGIGVHGDLGYGEILSIAHGIAGLYLLIGSFSNEGNAAMSLYTVATLAFVFACFAFWRLGPAEHGPVLEQVSATRPGEYLHFGLAAVMAGLAKLNTSSKHIFLQ